MSSNGGDILRASRMIKRGGQCVGSAAIALIHAYYVHTRRHALGGDAQHVLRFAGALEAVHNNRSERFFPLRLPVAMTQHLHAGFDFDQTPFGWRQRNSPRQKKARQGLKVATTHTASPHKFSS